MFEGSVDQVITTGATGWLYNRAEGRTSDVVAMLYGRVISEAPATLHRPDLEKVGFGDGRCGFDLPFHEPVQNSDLPFVIVRPRGSNLTLPRTVEDTYIDLVAELAARHPGAGRNRSVLGGFWTDRTDSLQILAGRVNAGSCPAALKDLLRRLIADGYVVLPAGTGRSVSDETLAVLAGGGTAEPSALQSAAAALGDALITEEFAGLLRAVFDDVPVAYSFVHLTEPSERMAQASASEPFTSPAEVLAVYLSFGEGDDLRLDYLRDSHEFPEFGRMGRSRWTAEGVEALPVIIAGQEKPIDSVELQPGSVTVVSPGLLHRIVTKNATSALCIRFAPKRNSPLRFLATNCEWREAISGQNIRIRLSSK